MNLSGFFPRARRRAILEYDAAKWRQALAPMRTASRPAAAKRVLFCDLMKELSGVKFEALLAGVMGLAGTEAVVLLPRRDRPIERLFSAAISAIRFAYLDSYLQKFSLDELTVKAEQLVASASSVTELVDVEWEGVRVGRNALSMVLRTIRAGQLDLDNPQHRSRMIAGLAQSFHAAKAARALVADVRPDHAVFNERGYTPAGEVFDACLLAGVDVMQWFGAPSADSLMFKRYDLANRGDHPMSISSGSWTQLQALPWTAEMDEAVVERIHANYESGAWYNRQQLQEGKAILSREDVFARLDIDPAKKTAVIFAHILYDATFFYGESVYPNYEAWLVETVRAAIANSGLNWVVKVHPVNVWRSRLDGASMEQLEAAALQRAFGALPPHVKIMPADTSVNTFSLFETIDYGLTVRGTIGMELPCFGIPVITAGSGRYSGRGFTIDPATRDAYQATLARLQDVPRLDAEAIRLARIHFYAAMLRRPVPMSSFMIDYTAGTYGLIDFRSDVRLTKRPGPALRNSPDLGRIADWLMNRNEQELLQATADDGRPAS